MKKLILSLALLFVLLPRSVFAEGPNIVDMTAHYKHPVTGAIEDSGKNEGIGQGMAEGVLHPQALYEEVGNKRYLTIRLHMMDNISKVSIATQKRGASGFHAVGFENPQGSGEWKDFRFQVPAKQSVIRLSLFIDAMGREVIFYGDMGNMTPGNTDFVASTTASASQSAAKQTPASTPQTPKANAKVDSTVPNNTSSVSAVEPSGALEQETPVESAHDTVTHGGASGLGDDENTLGYENGLLTDDSDELKNLAGEGGAEKEHEAPKKKAPWGPVTRIVFASFMAVVVLLTVGSLLAAGGFYFLYNYKRTLNEIREEADDETFDFEDF